MKIKQIDVNASNANEFNRLVNSENTIVFAAYVANWCSHCKRLKAMWMRILSDISRTSVSNQDIPLVVAMVEESFFGMVPSSEDVRGFPTIKIFVKGEFLENYEGERTPEGISQNLKKIVKTHGSNPMQTKPTNILRKKIKKTAHKKKTHKNKTTHKKKTHKKKTKKNSKKKKKTLRKMKRKKNKSNKKAKRSKKR